MKIFNQKLSVIEFCGVNHEIEVNLTKKFRVLQNIPKSWREITGCITSHNVYESGATTIYQSKNTKKYYMVRFFDGCFSKMFTEIKGFDWETMKNQMMSFWNSKELIRREILHLYSYNEINRSEKEIRIQQINNDAKKILIKTI